ncbi:hypothetical protein RIF29_10579 [Crotalaria pallida]|uniref:Uncharacterized protein n=1 Tax=Crotalaria pallida TaxID=3830 RepID=A0AAN9FW51_CROPI
MLASKFSIGFELSRRYCPLVFLLEVWNHTGTVDVEIPCCYNTFKLSGSILWIDWIFIASLLCMLLNKSVFSMEAADGFVEPMLMVESPFIERLLSCAIHVGFPYQC